MNDGNETVPQETLEWMRRPEHALWMSRLSRRIHEKEFIADEQIPECLKTAAPGRHGTGNLLKALAQAAGAEEDPKSIAGHFQARIPQPVLSEAARNWLDQPENAETVELMLSRWALHSFQETGAEAVIQEFDNPFTRSFPRHRTITKYCAGGPDRQSMNLADTAALLSQHAGSGSKLRTRPELSGTAPGTCPRAPSWSVGPPTRPTAPKSGSWSTGWVPTATASTGPDLTSSLKYRKLLWRPSPGSTTASDRTSRASTGWNS